jgi:ATP-dependent Clp protease ATP-binding subunit ClpB
MDSKRIELKVAPDALDALAEIGFNPAFGARPLKRVIQREIGDRAAIMILEGKATEGSSITVEMNGDAIELTTSG